MTPVEIAAFKKQQTTAAITAHEQEDVRLEQTLDNTSAMLRHLHNTLVDLDKQKPVPMKVKAERRPA